MPSGSSNRHPIEVLAEEYAKRYRRGERPSVDEYVRRFPQLAAEISELFPALELMEKLGPLREPAERGGGIGRVISHYRLETLLGAGGMGQVYLAHDRALGRPVALKLLPHDFSPSLRARLLREAWASARLQHPGIATFYDAGEYEGTAFIAMEFVEGQTLREALRNGPLTLDQSLAVTTCLLEALAHAHAAGIVHRDIKPENIMLTGERRAKLLDFGLAKPITSDCEVFTPSISPGQEKNLPSRMGQAGHVTQDYALASSAKRMCQPVDDLTADGTMVGTIGYMAPEQLRGEPIDQRCDLFGVGAVLYETVTGKRAFPGVTVRERFSAVTTKDLPHLTGPDSPPELDSILQRALSRDPSGRYRNAGEFLTDLRRVSDAAKSDLPDTLAVVPFRILSNNRAANWIGPAIAEGVFTRLASCSGIQLVPLPKVLKAAAGCQGADHELGLQLGCRWLLSGGVHAEGEVLRVTARLLEVPTGQVHISETVEVTPQELFSVQARLAATIAALTGVQLETTLSAEGSVPSSRLEAYQYCARGRQLFFKSEKGLLDQAQEMFERALMLELAFVPALSGLAALHAFRYTFTTAQQTLQAAKEYAWRALREDPDNAEAHVWLGYVLVQQEEREEAYRYLQRAMELDPSNFLACYFSAFMGLWNCCRGEVQELYRKVLGQHCVGDPHRWRRNRALTYFQRSLQINSQHGWSWVGAGMMHFDLENSVEARWCLEKAIALEEKGRDYIGPAGVRGYLGECLRRWGQLDEARRNCLIGLEEVEKNDQMYRDTLRGTYLCNLGRTVLQQGDAQAARAVFNQAVLHLRGRLHARAGGHVLVQALAGLAQTDGRQESFEQGLRRFEQRQDYDFSPMWFCTDDVTLLELARAASKLGRTRQAEELLLQALEYGSVEARREKGSG